MTTKLKNSPQAQNEGFQAPVSYRAVRRAYNTMRVIAGSVISLGAGFVVWASDAPAAPWALAAGLIMAADGLYRRTRGTSAQPLLVIDITVAGFLLITQGHTPSIEAAGFVYVLTAAFLLLTRRDAFALIGFAAAWAVPVAALSPIVDGSSAYRPVLETVCDGGSGGDDRDNCCCRPAGPSI